MDAMNGLNVLIIQHDLNICNKLKQELEKYNIDIKIANSGVDAYKILYKTNQKNQFDFIIINISLPDENGMEIVKFIKDKFTSKVIVYTTKKYKDYKKYKDRFNFDYFFEKSKKSIIDIIQLIIE